MSAALRQAQCERVLPGTLRDMTEADLDAVTRIEQEVHAHPWTRGNFADSLAGNCLCKIYGNGAEVLGYVILMPVLDEIELLDIAVAAAHQRKGLGHGLLQEALDIARGMNMRRMLLEVRPSNAAALKLYESAGFREMGRRRGYYPAAETREDAIMMERVL